MPYSPYYYSLRHTAKALRKITRGKADGALRIVDEMRVREFCRLYRCGLSEFGMLYDPAALRVLKKNLSNPNTLRLRTYHESVSSLVS